MAKVYVKKGKAPRIVKADELSAERVEDSIEVDVEDYSKSICMGFDKKIFLVENDQLTGWKVSESERVMKYITSKESNVSPEESMEILEAAFSMLGLNFRSILLKLRDYKKPEESLTEAFIRYSREHKK